MKMVGTPKKKIQMPRTVRLPTDQDLPPSKPGTPKKRKPLGRKPAAEHVSPRHVPPDATKGLRKLELLAGHIGEPVAGFLVASILHWPVKALTDAHMDGVAYLLSTNQNLSELGLARNRISAKGGVTLARALPFSAALRCLWLSSNQLGDRGAAALAQALPSLSWVATKDAPRLEELWMSGNDIGPAGAAALAAALPRMPRLTKIDLRFNPIGDDGAAAMATALPETALQAERLHPSQPTSSSLAAEPNQPSQV